MRSDPEVLAQREPAIPYLKRYPLLAGAAMGLLLRLMFSGGAGSKWSAMAGAFIFLAPVAVGMVTVYAAEQQRRRGWAYYFVAPALATGLFVVGTLLIMIEGLVCAIVILPMFAVLGGLGGLVMGVVCRWTDWPKPVMYGAGVLPLLMGLLGGPVAPADEFGSVQHSLHIEAPAAVVWQQLNAAGDIRAAEAERGWAYRIGVPLPLSGITHDNAQGKVHRFQMARGVHFEGLINEWQPEHRLRWSYRFAKDSFPPGSLDDHVLIGGHYFDLIDTEFELRPEGNGTRLGIRTRYRISTQFNLYADWVARLLLRNASEVILDLYGQRSQTAFGR